MKSIMVIDDKEKNHFLFCQMTYNEKFRATIVNGFFEAYLKLSTEFFDVVLVHLDLRSPERLQYFSHKILHLVNRKSRVLVCSESLDKDSIRQGLKNGIVDIFNLPLEEAVIAHHLDALASEAREAKTIYCGEVFIDLDQFVVSVKDGDQTITLDLTLSEFKLLLCLAQNAEKTVTREEILTYVWGSVNVQTRTVDAKVSNLRKKLKASKVQIVSVKKHGYKIAA